MSFVNTSLLLGVGLIAVPIVLHLLMRRQPKRLKFPAIRFVKPRIDTNQRTLHLRHWLLLLLRCGLVVALVIALARPNIDVARVGEGLVVILALASGLLMAGLLLIALQRRLGRGTIATVGILLGVSVVIGLSGMVRLIAGSSGIVVGGRESPVAAALIIDTAPRMLYRQQNRTRLEEAQKMAQAILRRLPAESQIAIVDGGGGQPMFAADGSSASRQVDRLAISYAARSIPSLLNESIRLLKTSEQSRREIYIVSDLAAAAWSESSDVLADKAIQDANVQVYLIDVGAIHPINIGLGAATLSEQRIARGGEVTLSVEAFSDGADQEVLVELYLQSPDLGRPVIVDGKQLVPESVRRDRQAVRVAKGSLQNVSFSFRGLDTGIHHGSVRIIGDDGLSVDDERYFTVEVQEAWKILVVAGRDAHDENFVNALVPLAIQQTDDTRFKIRRVDQGMIPNESLDNFDAVCLLDPAPLSPDIEERLVRYISDGGGVALIFGHNASPPGFGSDFGKQLIGCRLARDWRVPERDLYIAPDSYQHSILNEFRGMETAVPWSEFPVFRFWELADLAPSATVICGLNNNRPLLIENAVGAGRVLVMSTPLSDLARPKGRSPWNELFGSESPWPSFVLVNEMVLYLVERNVARLNFICGDTVALPNDSEHDPERYQLFSPNGFPTDVVAADNRVSLGRLDRPGIYYLKGKRAGIVQRGLSVNVAPVATQLERLDPKQLEAILGSKQFRLARSAEDIVRESGEARVGRDFYPYAMLTMAFLLAAEYLLANRFYRRESEVEATLPQARATELERKSA